MPDKIPSHEFTISCPLYVKCLKSCPSSKKVLHDEDIQLLKASCLTKKHTSCKFFIEGNEKAA